MTCKDLMTSDPACCTPEDSVVTPAMLMKRHNIGSVPVIEDRGGMRLVGIITDRDLALRVVAEQRDYYTTRAADVMSTDLVTCHQDDDANRVLKAMSKNQLRRIPVVGDDQRLVGIVAQADVALDVDNSDVAGVVQDISEPAAVHAGKGTSISNATMWIAGGLSVGAGLVYLLNPDWGRKVINQIQEPFRGGE